MTDKKIKRIVICASAAFYEHANQVAKQLKSKDFEAVVPEMATKMAQTGNYSVDAVKTWYKNPDDFKRKALLMKNHFSEVAEADAILVVNDKKHDIDGYIGPNVLMEMGLAFYLDKPIFVLNTIDKNMPVYEEVRGMDSIILDGDISKL